jgi:hypothetical protein
MGPLRNWLWAIPALIGAPMAWPEEARVDPEAPAQGGDIAPVLSVVGPAQQRSDRTVYSNEELWCALGYCAPPTRRGISAKPARPAPALPLKGFSLPLRLPQAKREPARPVVLQDAQTMADGTALDTIVVTAPPLSPWSTDTQLIRLERSLPCIGCDGTPQGPSTATVIGVNFLVGALRMFFQQPHVREEPNDEALYLAHDGCATDGDIRCTIDPRLP